MGSDPRLPTPEEGRALLVSVDRRIAESLDYFKRSAIICDLYGDKSGAKFNRDAAKVVHNLLVAILDPHSALDVEWEWNKGKWELAAKTKMDKELGQFTCEFTSGRCYHQSYVPTEQQRMPWN